MSLRIQVISTYPDKVAVASVDPEASFGDIKGAASKALNIDLKEYSFAAVSLGEDVVSLADKDDKSKPGIKENFSLIAIAPARLLPPRKKPDDAKESEIDEKFKGLTNENIFKKLATLKGKAKKTALEYLDVFTEAIVKTPIFLRLPKSAILSIVQRETIGINEVDLFDAIIRWSDMELKKDAKTVTPEARVALLKDIIPHIRFPTMTTEDVAAKVTPLNLLTQPQIMQLFIYLAQKETPGAVPGTELAVFKSTPRKGAGGAAKCVPPEGDLFKDTGAFYMIGSSFGKKPFVNPHTSGAIRMFTSDTPGWSSGWSETDLVDNLSTARDLTTDRSMNTGTWFAVDLKDYRINPTHYAMKNGGGRGLVLRDWNFEGKVNEADAWTVLRRHSSDSTYGSDGTNGFGLHSFPIDSPTKEFYRFFRILRTDSNQAIYVHRWEIYGNLKKVKP